MRDAKGDAFYGGRPMTLTKFGLPDWRPGMDAAAAAESPAQHRFPVWWTGDGVQSAGERPVDGRLGVHGFKPFVHSDCGGDYRPPNGGDLLRWTAHCVFGTVLRFHGNNHKPWSYDAHIEDVVKSYLETRYQLLPSLIAGGAEAAASGFPLVARGDLFWPDHPEAASNDQYLWLNDTLVAPVFDSSKNETTRDVWIPPGSWVDAWNGSAVTGPATLSVTQPYERQPMWHRSGGFVVLAPRGATRVDAQDWSHLVVDAHPAAGAATTRRHLAERVPARGRRSQSRPTAPAASPSTLARSRRRESGRSVSTSARGSASSTRRSTASRSPSLTSRRSPPPRARSAARARRRRRSPAPSPSSSRPPPPPRARSRRGL